MVRIIAKLDCKPPYVVKPVHFEGLRKIGEPVGLAEKYYLDGADEIFFIDIVASLYMREIQFELIKETSKNIYVPFAVGGNVKTVEDFSRLFHSGADKVALNTHALQKDPSIIDRASKIFGAQAVVVNIEAKESNGSWECYSDCGRIQSGKNAIDWAKEIESRGAGEILIQSVDKDGKQKGFDLELVSQVVNSVNIPVVAASGAGNINDIIEVVKYANPSGVAISSILHYGKATIEEIKNEIAIQVR